MKTKKAGFPASPRFGLSPFCPGRQFLSDPCAFVVPRDFVDVSHAREAFTIFLVTLFLSSQTA